MANNNTTNVLYEALKSQFEAQRTKALATITVYLTNPVGIGEHPQILDEIVEQTKSKYKETNDILKLEINDLNNQIINLKNELSFQEEKIKQFNIDERAIEFLRLNLEKR